ncbi:MAG: ATP-binding cassette domain-containing protein [Desulfovibrionaceae bacterium]
MTLQARLCKKLRHFSLDVELSCGVGETLCVVGPSGSGKTTLLRLLVGLERPEQGEVRMGGETLLDCRSRVNLPPQRRSAGLVFQDYSLFPHMTLWQNAMYAATDSRVVEELLETFGIAHLRNMLPGRISGGERQRGALCQALARKPRLLLLDEPFSALDLETRMGLRRVLREVQRTTPLCMIHVTHDLNEAVYLGDRILALKQGRLDPEWLERQFALLRREQAFVAERTMPPLSPEPDTRQERSLSHA